MAAVLACGSVSRSSGSPPLDDVAIDVGGDTAWIETSCPQDRPRPPPVGLAQLALTERLEGLVKIAMAGEKHWSETLRQAKELGPMTIRVERFLQTEPTGPTRIGRRVRCSHLLLMRSRASWSTWNISYGDSLVIGTFFFRAVVGSSAWFMRATFGDSSSRIVREHDHRGSGHARRRRCSAAADLDGFAAVAAIVADVTVVVEKRQDKAAM